MKHPIPVALSEFDRASLQTFIHAGKANARTFTRARVLLKAAEGWTDQQICDAFDISHNTSIRVRQLYLTPMLVDSVYPHAQYIRLVQDNLNTHTPAALYEAFEPAEARRILQRVEFHYTPKHGSWLNMAEIEISIAGRGCLSRRVQYMQDLRLRIATLEAQRCTISWRFTCNDARDKLRDLYPLVNNNLELASGDVSRPARRLDPD